MSKYYDWEKTLSYDADVTAVIGARGVGKTFGIRKQCIQDYIKRGYRFMEIVRYKIELSDVADGYFDRLAELDEFKDYAFRTDSRYMYIARKDSEDDKKKLQWNVLGYFVALSEQQKKKKKTYFNVRRIIFDEFILERWDRFHNYLPNEPTILANMVDTASRERADTDGVEPRVYLLANACDIANPYFAFYKVSTDLEFGYRWYNNKNFLLHYVDPENYAKEKLEGTVAGRMLAGTEAGRLAAYNEFVGYTDDFVEQKPGRAKFNFGLVCNGKKYGIWLDMTEGLYYVSKKIPNNTNKVIYSLTTADSGVNYVAAKRASGVFRIFSEAYYLGIIRYESLQIKTDFVQVLQLFGVR